jgi:hypothetical protein
MSLRAIRILKSLLKRLDPSLYSILMVQKNELVWPLDSSKHRFVDITKVEFYDVQKTDYEFSGPFA